ncbi:MAG: site-specific integrase [Gammaproteobacteria bacterium]|nr:MAG: site-specific integrase [Gammaproteobacteria bacterium]RLA53746.1 MAG: site-specific integrase [Gammaproteobacteria bacterium]
MSKRIPGLYKRGKQGIWHIDKCIKGYGRLHESTDTSNLKEAEQYLIRRLEEMRKASVYGIRPERSFRQAATKFLLDYQHKRSIDRYAQSLKILDTVIGDLPLRQVHQGTLDKFIQYRRKQGMKANTINRDLAVVRRILNLAARLWRDEYGLTWLQTAPLLQLLDCDDARKPYPLSWEEQAQLFGRLPEHLRDMVLFKVNTGTREQEVTCLRWDWEVSIPELKTSVFIIPGEGVKNGEDRLVVMNTQARAVINRQRGKHPEHVFTYSNGKPVDRINTKAWRRAREEVGIPQVRVHDLKHTFGRRLRAQGVSHETRQVLLGHKNGQITTHYSAAEIGELLEAVEKVSWSGNSTPTLTLLRSENSRKFPAVGRRKKACTD